MTRTAGLVLGLQLLAGEWSRLCWSFAHVLNLEGKGNGTRACAKHGDGVSNSIAVVGWGGVGGGLECDLDSNRSVGVFAWEALLLCPGGGVIVGEGEKEIVAQHFHAFVRPNQTAMLYFALGECGYE